VYGLAACFDNDAALRKVYDIKGRPHDKPLSVLIGDVAHMKQLCVDIPVAAYKLAYVFWPGPLTMVLKKQPHVSDIVTAGGDTVAVRCPDHDMALSLLNTIGKPLATPSANLSSMPPPVTARDAAEGLDGLVEIVLDGGDCDIGAASTIVDMTGDTPRVLREGAISQAQIDAVTSRCVIGITGGIGAGKTTVTQLWAEQGMAILNCDDVYQNLYMQSMPMQMKMASICPEAYDDGQIDMVKFSDFFFSDYSNARLVESIVHPLILREIGRRILATQSDIVVEAIMLLESDGHAMCDATVAVIADDNIRLQRVLNRDGISEAKAKSIMAFQRQNEFYRDNAHYIIVNNGDRNKLRADALDILNTIRRDTHE
jgi:L-threonylcarbamoyladenylate synthase